MKKPVLSNREQYVKNYIWGSINLEILNSKIRPLLIGINMNFIETVIKLSFFIIHFVFNDGEA